MATVPAAGAGYRIEPLDRGHERRSFNCGAPALDRYLQQQARQDAQRHIAAPFVLVDSVTTRVLGYYTLSASALGLDALPPEVVQKLPRYPQLPVTLLGRLAVDRSVKGQGLGEFLLLDALHRSLQTAATIASMAVVVDAKDDAAARFYAHMNFLALQAQPTRLFLPMQSIAALFD